MAVNVGGMCWVISTGARSSTPAILPQMALSACGPPVEAPISSTRGGVSGMAAQRDRRVGHRAPRGRGRSGTMLGAVATVNALRARRARGASARIFSISSRRKLTEVVTS